MLHALLSSATLFAADQPQGDPNSAMMLPIMLMGLFFLFWLFIIRPSMRRQEQERQAMMSNLEKNDRVLTSGGIYGTIVNVSDKEDEITVKVDDNVKLKMTKGSIVRNVTKEDKAREAASTAKAASK